MSSKGSVKILKQDRKIKERVAQEMSNLNVLIGRLEDRDTQQQAFATLLQLLPELDPSLVKEIYVLIEKNKKPNRSSTRRMLVLVIAALCKCHPAQTGKLLSRILSYLCLRLRDKHAKTTEACVILVSTISLYVLPCPSFSLSGFQTKTFSHQEHGHDDDDDDSFEAVAAILLRETTAVGEEAIKCLCGLLRPVAFDGVADPGPGTILAHATRIRPYFNLLVADTIAKIDRSRLLDSFSPFFLVLQSACQLARDAHVKASFPQLGDDFAPYIASVYEAIEDAFQCGFRDNWILRKRALELLTLILDIFALQSSPWCLGVDVAQKYFQTQLERVRLLVLAGRHDSVSSVRNAAVPAMLAFECLEKMFPQSATKLLQSNTSNDYDFVSPDPPGYAFTSKRWKKRLPSSGDGGTDDRNTNEEKRPSLFSSAGSTQEENKCSFDDAETGDGALPLCGLLTNSDPFSSLEPNVVRSCLNLEAKATTMQMAKQKSTKEYEMLINVQTDEALAPENSVEADPTQLEKQPSIKQHEGLRPSGTGFRQFIAKQKSSRHHDISQIFVPKRRSFQAANSIRAAHNATTSQSQLSNYNVESDGEGDGNNPIQNHDLTRAEAALEAAQCEEYELAFRLCIIEDDLDLLRRMMINTPCMKMLSAMTRNALCTAFLSFLESHDSSDVWLVLHWMQQWTQELKDDRRQIQELDPRISNAISAKLKQLAMTSTKLSLAAAHVAFLLGM